MGAALVPVLIGLAVLVVAVLVVQAASRRQQDKVEETRRPDVGTLRYAVPDGQDPAAVVTALQNEGYDAVVEGTEVVVPCRTDPQRERAHVRSVIAAAPLNLEGDPAQQREVRFRDE